MQPLLWMVKAAMPAWNPAPYLFNNFLPLHRHGLLTVRPLLLYSDQISLGQIGSHPGREGTRPRGVPDTR
jgi:hypothetical protein